MGNVVDLPCVTKLPIEPDKVLEGAKGVVDTAVVVGWDKEGEQDE